MGRMNLTEAQADALRTKLAENSRHGYGPRLTPEQRRQLVLDYVSDPSVTAAALARRYGIRPQSAHYLLRKADREARGE